SAVSTRPRVAASFSAIIARRASSSCTTITTSTARVPSRVSSSSLRETPRRERKEAMGSAGWGRHPAIGRGPRHFGRAGRAAPAFARGGGSAGERGVRRGRGVVRRGGRGGRGSGPRGVAVVQAEGRGRAGQVPGLVLQAAGGGRGLLDQGGVLLGGLVELGHGA